MGIIFGFILLEVLWPCCIWMSISLFSLDFGYFQLVFLYFWEGLEPSHRPVLGSAVRPRLFGLPLEVLMGSCFPVGPCAGRTPCLLCLIGAGSGSQAHQGLLLGPRSGGCIWFPPGLLVYGAGGRTKPNGTVAKSSGVQNCFQFCSWD